MPARPGEERPNRGFPAGRSSGAVFYLPAARGAAATALFGTRRCTEARGPKEKSRTNQSAVKKIDGALRFVFCGPAGHGGPCRPCRAPIFACGAEGRQENLFCRVGIKPGFLPARPGVGDQTGAFRRAAHQAPFSAPAARGDGSRRPFFERRSAVYRAHLRFPRPQVFPLPAGKPPPQQSHPRPRAK